MTASANGRLGPTLSQLQLHGDLLLLLLRLLRLLFKTRSHRCPSLAVESEGEVNACPKLIAAKGYVPTATPMCQRLRQCTATPMCQRLRQCANPLPEQMTILPNHQPRNTKPGTSIFFVVNDHKALRPGESHWGGPWHQRVCTL